MREVAEAGPRRLPRGDDVVVVVSAMSGETDRLLALGRRVLPEERAARSWTCSCRQESRVSCALVAMAIRPHGGQACSLLGLSSLS
ncbi:MAG: hypothetical protein R3F14_09775 [Polyangiaceae bacterium]